MIPLAFKKQQKMRVERILPSGVQRMSSIGMNKCVSVGCAGQETCQIESLDPFSVLLRVFSSYCFFKD